MLLETLFSSKKKFLIYEFIYVYLNLFFFFLTVSCFEIVLFFYFLIFSDFEYFIRTWWKLCLTKPKRNYFWGTMCLQILEFYTHPLLEVFVPAKWYGCLKLEHLSCIWARFFFCSFNLFWRKCEIMFSKM